MTADRAEKFHPVTSADLGRRQRLAVCLTDVSAWWVDAVTQKTVLLIHGFDFHVEESPEALGLARR